MNRHLLAGLIVLVITLPAQADEPVSADLEMRTRLAGFPFGPHPLSEHPPEGVSPIPGDQKVWYSNSPFGDRRLLAAVQFEEEPLWLRVDTDFDRDLSDESPVHEIEKGGRHFKRLRIPVGPIGEQLDVSVHFYIQRQRDGPVLWINTSAFWVGEVVLEGRARDVHAADRSGDLRFDDPVRDWISLDLDGDRVTTNNERVWPGKPFRIGDHGYVVAVPDGMGRVEFRRSETVPPLPPVVRPKGRVPLAGRRILDPEPDLASLVMLYEAAAKQVREGGPGARSARSARFEIVPRIGRVGTPEAFAKLKRICEADSSPPALKLKALQAMGRAEYVAKADAVSRLVRKSRSPELRGAAVEVLHGMGAPDRERLLRSRLKAEKDPTVLRTIVLHLAYLGTPSARNALEEMVSGRADNGCRAEVYAALLDFFGEPVPAGLTLALLESGVAEFRFRALREAFDRHLPESRDYGLEVLRGDDVTDPALEVAVRHLATASDPEAVKALLHCAVVSEPHRERIVYLLQPVRVNESVQFLLDRLAQGADEERIVAAGVLTGMKGPLVADTVLQRIPREKSGDLLAHFLRIATTHPSPEMTSAILAAIDPVRASAELLAAAADYFVAAGTSLGTLRRYIERALGRKEWQKRVIALDLLSEVGGPAEAATLLAAAKDRVWQVRLTAVEGLRRIRVKEAIVPLIDLLEAEEIPRVREAISETLWMITGWNLYDLVDLWRRWWKEHGEEFEVSEEPPGRVRGGQAAGSVASFYGLPVRSERIVFVIDQSGSMAQETDGTTRLDRAVSETLGVAAKLPRRARIDVILFESAVHSWKGKLVRVGPATQMALRKHLKAESPRGGTNLYDALEAALLTPDVEAVYLLSDGRPGEGRWIRTRDILREVKKRNRFLRVAVHCVSVGRESHLLRSLAAQNGGCYVRR